MYKPTLLLAAAALGAMTLLAAPSTSFAAGDGGSSYSSGKKTKRTAQDDEKCARNRVWSERSKKCVRPDSAALTDDERYGTGRALAYAGDYANAIPILEASDKGRARTMNMLGFAHRKAGHVDKAMGYYRAALEIDPGYTLARSYMGVSLLDGGDRAGAEKQLALIRATTGTGTYEYKLLAKALGSDASAGAYRY